jgi:hypothetical protein
MNRAGCDWKPCEKYPGSIAHRAQKLHEYLAKGRDRQAPSDLFSVVYQNYSSRASDLAQLG